jgi:hypothetical protein
VAGVQKPLMTIVSSPIWLIEIRIGNKRFQGSVSTLRMLLVRRCMPL